VKSAISDLQLGVICIMLYCFPDTFDESDDEELVLNLKFHLLVKIDSAESHASSIMQLEMVNHVHINSIYATSTRTVICHNVNCLGYSAIFRMGESNVQYKCKPKYCISKSNSLKTFY